MHNLLHSHSQNGFIALLTVIIISAAALIIAYNASLLGLGELDMGYDSQRGGETLSIADGCMEEAFSRLKLDSNYNGGALNLGDGSCTIVVVANVNDRIITITSTLDIYNKKIEADVTLIGNVITINSWTEKTD